MSATAVIAGIQAASAVFGLFGSAKAKKAKKKAARAQYLIDQENSRREQQEIQESIRRTRIAQRQNYGTSVNRAAGSGFLRSGSVDRNLQTIDTAQETELEWMKTAGVSLESIRSREADARKRVSDSEARGAFHGAIGQSLSSLAGAYGTYKGV